MTIDALWDKLMPIMGPLSNSDGVVALAMVIPQLRGKTEVDEATANRLLDELRARFCKPLS